MGLTYILKSIASCNVTDQPTLVYTLNLAFMNYFHEFWGNRSLDHIPVTPTVDEVTLPISMEDYPSDPDYQVYGNEVQRNPETLKELSQLNFKKQLFLENRNFFLKQRQKVIKENQFFQTYPCQNLFTAIVHIYMFTGSTLGILWALPYVWYAIKHRKLSALVGAMAMYKASPAEAMPIGITQGQPDKLTALDIPSNSVTKLVCHDPWISFVLAVITVLGLVVYLYQNCKHLTLVKGQRFVMFT